MTCQDFLQQLDILLDNRSGQYVIDDAFEAHLRECPRCRLCYEGHLAVEQCLRAIPRKKAPPELVPAIMNQLPIRTHKALASRPLRWRMLGAAAAVVMLLGSPLYALSQQARTYVQCGDPVARLEITSNEVVVPLDVQVLGDLKVINGRLTVLGTVHGHITLVRSVLVSGPEARVGTVETMEWSWLERLSFSLAQMRDDVRSFVRGAWK